MKQFFIIFLTALFAVCVASCDKDILPDGTQSVANDDFLPLQEEIVTVDAIYRADPGVEGLRPFAKALYIALSESPALRKLIRDRALERFNRESDVLYQFIKNEPLENGLTVRELLLRFMESGEELAAIEEKHPTLTVFVPQLPEDCFSADNWNTDEQIPAVAIHSTRQMNIPIFAQAGFLDAERGETVIKAGIIPGFPVVVLKDNKSVVVSKNSSSRYASLNNPGSDYVFDFTDDYYDGSRINDNPALRSTTYPFFVIDQKLKDAYNMYGIYGAVGWQRDYVYYNLEYPNALTGFLSRNFSETVCTFRFAERNTPQQMLNFLNLYGNPGDPVLMTGGIPAYGEPYPWSAGSYNFRITVETGSDNSQLAFISKEFSADPDELFEVSFKKVSLGWGLYFYYPSVSGFNTKLLEIPLFTWDLSTFATNMKFTVYKVNPSTTQTNTYTSQTNFAGNISFEKKEGLKFGASAGITKTSTTSVVKNIADKSLGDFFIGFHEPSVISMTSMLKICSMLEYDGGYYKLTVFPKKQY